jgi:hypothetical protein
MGSQFKTLFPIWMRILESLGKSVARYKHKEKRFVLGCAIYRFVPFRGTCASKIESMKDGCGGDSLGFKETW